MKSLFILLLSITSLTWSAQSVTNKGDKNQTLTGLVSEEGTNTPLSEVKITFLSNGKAVAKTKTKKDGTYAVILAEGKYEAEFSLPGFETNRVLNVTVTKAAVSYCDVPMQKSTLPGQSITWEWAQKSHGTTAKIEKTRTKSERSADIKARGAGVKLSPTSHPVTESVTEMDDLAPMMEEKASGVEVRSPEPMESYAMSSPPPAGKAMMKTISAPEKESASKDEVLFDKKTTPRSPGTPKPQAGLLTAGEWNDLDNWATHWTDLLTDGEIDAHQTTYGFFPRHRYTVLLTNTDDFPIIDAGVTLIDDKGATIWEGRTDNTGKAELWYGLNEKTATAPQLTVYATIDGKKQTLGKVKPSAEGINRFAINRQCQASQKVDIVWAVDATGSMGDEIEYLKTESLDVIGRVKTINPNLSLRMSAAFYRDVTDDYLVKSSGLSADISKTVSYIREQYAGGGGDYPEAVHSALEEAIYRQDWSSDAVARICFLVLDASPHQTPEINASIQRSIREAARKGIRIVPVSASGIQKDTEFLMKFFGLATNGTYLFLTDHSGIGGKHIEATTDEYKVELLNNLLVRIISQYTSVASCDGKSQVVFENPMIDSLQQQTASLQTATYYPNPAVNYVTLDLPFDAQKVTLYNAEGKAVYSLAQTTIGRHTIPVADLPGGYYSLRIWKDNQTQSGKILVIKT